MVRDLIALTLIYFLPCIWDEKLRKLLNRGGTRLSIDLLILIFFKLALSLNFRTEVFLNEGLVCKFRGWKFIILSASFCKIIRRGLFDLVERGH